MILKWVEKNHSSSFYTSLYHIICFQMLPSFFLPSAIIHHFIVWNLPRFTYTIHAYIVSVAIWENKNPRMKVITHKEPLPHLQRKHKRFFIKSTPAVVMTNSEARKLDGTILMKCLLTYSLLYVCNPYNYSRAFIE